MAEGDDLLQKADALMRRHRAYVAGASDNAESSPDGDVPVLTEIVQAETPAPHAGAVASSELHGALVRELEAWLDEELPRHVMRVLDGVTDQLVGQLSLKAKSDLLPRLQAAVEATAKAANRAPPED